MGQPDPIPSRNVAPLKIIDPMVRQIDLPWYRRRKIQVLMALILAMVILTSAVTYILYIALRPVSPSIPEEEAPGYKIQYALWRIRNYWNDTSQAYDQLTLTRGDELYILPIPRLSDHVFQPGLYDLNVALTEWHLVDIDAGLSRINGTGNQTGWIVSFVNQTRGLEVGNDIRKAPIRIQHEISQRYLWHDLFRYKITPEVLLAEGWDDVDSPYQGQWRMVMWL